MNTETGPGRRVQVPDLPDPNPDINLPERADDLYLDES